MSRPGYADRALLKSWADQLVSKGEFPRLVRQLILETTPGLLALGMPAGDGVAAGGWDGSVRATSGNSWVPQGYSVWELSVDASPGTKANIDFGKRHSTPDGTPLAETTYVEAILRPWTARDEWARDKSKAGIWAAVRALGLDDIDMWLQAAPVTWAWLSEEFGLNPYGLRSGRSWWTAWSSQTSPALPPELVLSGRDDAAAQLRDAKAGITTIGGTAGDVCAFVAAVGAADDLGGDGRLLARLALIDDSTTWRRLLNSSTPLVLVPLNADFAGEVPADSIHTVIVPVPPEGRADISLPALDATSVKDALLSTGFDDERQADALGRLARRSLTALRRRLAKKPELVRPPWAQNPTDRARRAALLLGSWSDAVEGDREIAEALSGESYERFREACTGLAAGEDPMLTQVGQVWHLVSPVDAWMLLGGALHEDDLTRLEPAVASVIGEVDPALDLPPEERWWRAGLDGKQRRYSSALSRGLSHTLALLGVHGEDARVKSLTGSDWARYLVRQLLEAAIDDATGHGWHSLAPMLPLLAEAAPDAFADAVVKALATKKEVMVALFADQGTDLFGASSPHTHLLWALEVLAWSVDHFGQAIDLLARLDELDPGGRTSNRPSASLSGIFCPWFPETTTSVDGRLKALDAMRRRHPEVAWSLLLNLLPKPHATHMPTAAPEFRDWKPSTTGRVTNGEYYGFATACVERLLKDAGTDTSRWISLIDHYSHLPADDRATLRSALVAAHASGGFDALQTVAIWERLQSLTGEHREFASATWALPEDELVELDTIAESMKPSAAADRHAYLFDNYHPHLPGETRRDDFDAFDAALAEHRDAAACEVLAEGGVDAVVQLARRVEFPQALGYALGASGPDSDEELFAQLDSEDSALADLSFAYYARRFRTEGWGWLETVLSRAGHTQALQRAKALLATRDFPRSWEVAAEEEAVHDMFWRHFGYLGLGTDFEHVEFVCEQLIEAQRFGDALYFIRLYERHGAMSGVRLAEVIANLLENLLEHQDQITATGLHDYDFAELVSLLEEHVDELGAGRVAHLEWSYLTALGLDPEVPTLSKALATDPQLFADLIISLYAADPPEENLADEEARAGFARNAWQLLRAWHEPPGLRDGVMDAVELRAWVDGVVGLLEPSGRESHALRNLGPVLLRTPPDKDGTWPGVVVRDLLEDLQSEALESGLYTGLVNSRGVTTRGLEDGGVQEVALADKYLADAAGFAVDSPRTAAVLRGVAESYQRDARRNETEAERFRRGLS